jgi:hypothetical protein
MADWKKIVVSGSDAELNQLSLTSELTALNISNTSTVAGTQLTGSFTGSFVGDGSGLTGLATNLSMAGDTGTDEVDLLTDTLTFTGANGIITSVSDNEVTITAGEGVVSSSAQIETEISGAFTEASSALAADIVTNDGRLDTLEGKTLVSSSAQVDAASVTNFDSEVKDKLNADGVISGSSVSLDSQGTFTATFNGVDTQVDLGLQTSDSPIFDGLTVSNDLTVAGNLDVQGTVTAINSTNTTVEDRFILLASGSTSGDGGIVVNTNDVGLGTAFYFDGETNRWALTPSGSVSETATSVTPTQYLVSVSQSAAAPGANPEDFGADEASRRGMMHVDTSNGDIYIYS